MRDTAVLTIRARDTTATFRLTCRSWASPEYQVPHLATFVHRRASTGQPLTVAAYADLADALWPAAERIRASGSDDGAHHRYQLTFDRRSEDRVTLRAESRATHGPGAPYRWQTVCEAHGLAALYREAAEMMRRRARFMCGFARAYRLPPGYPTEADLLRQRDRYQRWADRVDAGTLPAPVAPEPVQARPER